MAFPQFSSAWAPRSQLHQLRIPQVAFHIPRQRASEPHALLKRSRRCGDRSRDVPNSMVVLKICLQAQKAASSHVAPDGTAVVSAKPSLKVVKSTIKIEDIFAWYHGVGLFAVREGTTQVVNFTVYNMRKDACAEHDGQVQRFAGAWHDCDCCDRRGRQDTMEKYHAATDACAPGQAVLFTVYELLKGAIQGSG